YSSSKRTNITAIEALSITHLLLTASTPHDALFFFESYDDLRDLHSFPTRRSSDLRRRLDRGVQPRERRHPAREDEGRAAGHRDRSEEHTSELQSRGHLVCRLLLEKKKEVEVLA